jgi:hypothetical protein
MLTSRSPGIAAFPSSQHSIYEHVFAIEVDPGRRYVGCTIWEEGTDERERSLLEKIRIL